jgi:hypothetical protein
MPYDRGNYQCEITGQGFGEIANEKKTPYYFLDVNPLYRVNPNDPDGQGIACETQRRSVKLWLTAPAIELTIERLRSLGWEGTKFSEIDADGSFSFRGTKVVLECTHRMYEGETYDDFGFMPMGKTTASTPGVAKNMDALFGASLKGAAAKKPKPTPKPKPANEPTEDELNAEFAAAAADEDDIPF